jgi:two-component system, response regulator PdtaR
MLQHSPTTSRSTAAAGSAMQAFDLHGLQVLLLEDNAVVAMDIADTLAALGCALCGIARSESEAVKAAEMDQPDLIIADVNLQHGCGIAAVERIVKQRFVPHLFITGDVQTVLHRAPGAIAVAKPFEVRALIAAVRRALRGAPQPAEDRRARAFPGGK